MVAISDKIQERTLEFSNRSLISFASNWSISAGTGSINVDSIDLDEASTASLSLTNVNKKLTYLKIVCRVTSDDTSLNTQYSKNVAVIYKITYTDNNIPDTTDIFYPNFDFEDNYEYYTIIQLSGDKVKNISIQVINSEETDISVVDVGLYYITQVTSDNINDVLQDEYDNDPTEFDNLMQEYLNNNVTTMQQYIYNNIQLIIPTVTRLPSASSVPDGYICKLR